MTLLTLETFFRITGLFLLGVAGRIASDRTHPARWGSAAFCGWALRRRSLASFMALSASSSLSATLSACF